MRLTLTVDLDNAAMQTAADVSAAVQKSLANAHSLFTPLWEGEIGMIFDSNGNTVGKWEVREDAVPA